MTPLKFIHTFDMHSAPPDLRARIKLNLLDLIGIAAAGRQTRLAQIINDHAAENFGGILPMLFDGRKASAQGAALAAGMTIDSLDGHDGFNPAKGHIGCPMMPAALMLGHEANISGQDFLNSLIMGYEFGARAAMAQHGTVPDYHTSGSWGATAAAAAGARLANLTPDQTGHALGIAEYHGPRSQMMRCIDHPTMLKDGAGWGAMSGVAAVKLALSGFTGAPALTIEQAPDHWQDLGEHWYLREQYFKPYPVCRWAQPPIEAALKLRQAHHIQPAQIDKIEIITFHQSVRLATSTPRTTEEAQYSTSFPVAVALARGTVTPADIADDNLTDPEILRLSRAMQLREDDTANAAFPARRIARVAITLLDGRHYESDWNEARWDASAPPSENELREKYRALADPVLGPRRAGDIESAIDTLEKTALNALSQLILCAL
ncbi:MAG: MmgE/PrpD family protein [Paracoccaceae bacterium]|nr:MmgE/PrpD family protein [Paracoccaceae bacterium]